MEKGESGKVVSEIFLTDKDGESFYKALYLLEHNFLSPIMSEGNQIDNINNILISFNNEEATVFINELVFNIEVLADRPIEKGEVLTFDDYRGVSSLSFNEYTIAIDRAIIFVFTHGWKRGVYFNLCPNHPEIPINLDNIERQLGLCFEKLLYSHIYQYSDDVFQKAYEIGWFPFLSLFGNGQEHLLFLLNRIREDKDTNNAEQRLVDFFDKDQLEKVLRRVQKSPALNRHIKFIEVGIKQYLEGGEENYISAGSTLYPRIEGILRDLYDPNQDPRTAKELGENLESVIASINSIPGVYFPTHFVDYLDIYYFKKFSRKNKDIPLSRHSHGHGESIAEDYTQKSILLLILMFDQLGRYLAQYKPADSP